MITILEGVATTQKHEGWEEGQMMTSTTTAECRETHSSHSAIQQPNCDPSGQRMEKYILGIWPAREQSKDHKTGSLTDSARRSLNNQAQNQQVSASCKDDHMRKASNVK